ncbi:LOW QUALITY PROTEIN: hypothetical protein TorRG33x02_146890 [Trema orientale]|uniref:Transmembrane protein n=1 Tax=Trema orientale TaxID=63057 RepID=A0A2P5EVL0_TREOI|nr:LOW QUALITY PROTEIN: hypothetical protein TorRG33x02_146890 [Trema orientale]
MTLYIYEYMYKCVYLEILLIHIISFFPFTMTLLPLFAHFPPRKTSRPVLITSNFIHLSSTSSVSSPFTTNFATFLYQNHHNTTVHKTLYPAHMPSPLLDTLSSIPVFQIIFQAIPATIVSCATASQKNQTNNLNGAVPYCQVPPNSDTVDS